jgi:soluble lytic murein transglycosylase-like protein
LWSASVCVAAFAAATPLHAQIFGAVDNAGGVLLTNLAGDGDLTLVVAAPPAPPAPITVPLLPEALLNVLRTPAAYREMIAEAAQAAAVNPALLHAVIKVESSYNPRAVSKKGAQGMMQLMPQTSRRLGVVDPFSPRDNIMGGARYLRELLDLFNGRVELALAAYNAGELAVIRSGYKLPPYPETQSYVPRVLQQFRALTGTL